MTSIDISIDEALGSEELMTVQVRYKPTQADETSHEIVHPALNHDLSLNKTSDHYRFVQRFGMLLIGSEFKGKGDEGIGLSLWNELHMRPPGSYERRQSVKSNDWKIHCDNLRLGKTLTEPLTREEKDVCEEKKWPVPFVLIRKDAIERDDKLRTPGNNGRKTLAIELKPEYGEKEICDSLWQVPYVLPVGEGGVEVATFTEFSGQDRHKHGTGIEIYTVLKGTMEIYIDDNGPYVLHEMEEVIILPGTVHEVVEKIPERESNHGEFAILVRVHSINCFGAMDKFIQTIPSGEWKRWDLIPKEERAKAFRKQTA